MVAFWFTLLALGVGVTGIVLASSADQLGEAFRLERSVTGFILLAAATSLPELIVSGQLAWNDLPDMAVGGVMGSCLINLLILAGIDLSQRSRGRILSRRAAAHALAALASIMMAAIVGVCVLMPGLPTLGRFHVGTVLVFLSYFVTVRLVFVDRVTSEPVEPHESVSILPETASEQPTRHWLRPLLYYLGATGVILALAAPLTGTSESLATILGLSGTFFGAVFIALVTSLPEAVTTYQATRMDAHDLAIGNILGSNTFNLLILVAIDAFYHKPLFSDLGPVHAITALGIIVTTTIAVMGILYRVEKRIWYLEPDAAGVILSALLFFYFVYSM
ncbi:sodium:calcium antiporter [Stieleria varia]|uniref:Inner membrane protein YrbG n=1 Tax=Stieleria varia TaxID=2528005 RepID=A0A5C6A3I1_9BACT|nr:sodium:calcium antiporter [Stieleria varia]TWT93818.1 Inner membrane protein YrbG [Stieleria varia]